MAKFRVHPVPATFWTALSGFLAIGITATALLSQASSNAWEFVLLWIVVAALIAMLFFSVRQQHGSADDRAMYEEIVSLLGDAMNYARTEYMKSTIPASVMDPFYEMRQWSRRPERHFVNKSIEAEYQRCISAIDELLETMDQHSHSDGERRSPKLMYTTWDPPRYEAALQAIDASQDAMVEAYDRFVDSARQLLAK